MPNYNLFLPTEIDERLKKQCEALGISKIDLIYSIITEKLHHEAQN